MVTSCETKTRFRFECFEIIWIFALSGFNFIRSKITIDISHIVVIVVKLSNLPEFGIFSRRKKWPLVCQLYSQLRLSDYTTSIIFNRHGPQLIQANRQIYRETMIIKYQYMYVTHEYGSYFHNPGKNENTSQHQTSNEQKSKR